MEMTDTEIAIMVKNMAVEMVGKVTVKNVTPQDKAVIKKEFLNVIERGGKLIIRGDVNWTKTEIEKELGHSIRIGSTTLAADDTREAEILS